MTPAVLAALILTSVSATAAGLKVAVLHPLLGDMVREVGGSAVEVVDLIGPKGDPHHFEPSPENLKKADGAKLYLVAGMGLEGYLPKLRTILAGEAEIIEIGATLPALEGECGEEAHDDHSHAVDPHWWHSITLFSRATFVLEKALIEKLPEKAAEITKNAEDYRHQLADLEKWTRKQLAQIPRQNRHLATAHAAFNYFCKDFGFIPHPIQGINREQMPGPAELAKLVKALKDNRVIAIFPERESNPKILQSLTTDTGIKLGEPLIADGTGGRTYEEMVRHNVTSIVDGLRAE